MRKGFLRDYLRCLSLSVCWSYQIRDIWHEWIDFAPQESKLIFIVWIFFLSETQNSVIMEEFNNLVMNYLTVILIDVFAYFLYLVIHITFYCPSCPIFSVDCFSAVKRPQREADASSKFSARVKNEQNCTFSRTHAFVVWFVIKYKGQLCHFISQCG